MSKSKKLEINADIGDYLKLCACTAVMLQPILSLALTAHPAAGSQFGIGLIYNLVKFTAPAFIFGILYTTTRTTLNAQLTYGSYLNKQWHALFIPTIWWTFAYLLLMPNVQQVNQFHDLPSFLWHFINGNAAPHLWYNTMMLQFIILMPLFWAIGHWCGTNKKRGWITLGGTLLITAAWLLFYDTAIFQGPHAQSWYLFDRLFISFFIYGVGGVLAWQYRASFNRMLQKFWPILVVIFLASFYWTNYELHQFGTPVDLANAPYYKPSMTIYDLAVIGLIAALALFQIQRKLPFTAFVHKFAGFAYKAYLSNVFWSQLIWHLFGQQLTGQSVLLGVILTYACTWCLSFASAFGLHALWQKVKALSRSDSRRLAE